MSRKEDNIQNPATTGIHSAFKLIPLIIQLLIITVKSDDDCHHTTTTTPRGGDTIQMLRGSPFKIALFADLHFGEATSTEWGPQQDVKSIKVMSTVLDLEQPEFVIYLGDVITANNLLIANASLYWDQAITPTRERGIPWASVFGNHDDASFVWPIDWFSTSGIPHWYCPPAPNFSHPLSAGECSFKGTTRLELMQTEIKNNTLLSYSKNGPKELWPGVSNYVLQVSSSNDDTQVPVAYLYFFDSGGGSYPEVISTSQAQWFNHTSQKLNPDSRVPEIIFWHIPSKAYKKVSPKYDLHKKCVGSLFSEKVAAQQAEMGIMKLLESRSSVKAVFVGHNHGLDWCCPYKKLYLCYARHTGYGGYGNWHRGARVLEIIEKPFALKSWIRMEDGHVHSEIHLVT